MPERFRIVHFAASDSSGVGRSALRIHAGLLALGEDSSLLVKEHEAKGRGIYQAKVELPPALEELAFAAEIFQRWYIDHNRTPISNSAFSSNECGYAIEDHPLVRDADIIHLHSIQRFLSPASIAQLVATGKPVVWTIHDMRPFTGGCHFSAGCQNFTTTCPVCPQLAWDPYFLSEAQLGDALEVIPVEKITFVAPTEWLANKARASALLKKSRIEVIPYGLEPGSFPARWKPQAKNHLGLDQSALHLLFVANRLGETRKGFDHLARSIQILAARPQFKEKAENGQIALISIGHPHPSLATLGIPYVSLGFSDSDEEMSQLYGAADLFLLPSLEENLPNTLLEAMSSGTPPIAFAVGGVPEVITQDENGKLVTPGNDEEFANAIESLLFDENARQTLGSNCRTTIQERFNHRAQAEHYLRVYRRAMNGRPHTQASESDPFGFGSGNDYTVKKLAPISARLEHICTDSLPRPLQKLMAAMDRELVANKAELEELRDFLDGQQRTIEELQAELDDQRGALRKQETTIFQQNQILSSGAVKMLRQLKLIKK